MDKASTATPPLHANKCLPPPPSSSGVLPPTSAGAPANMNSTSGREVNIRLTFDLKSETNIINFSREVLRNYGLAALNPRLAACQVGCVGSEKQDNWSDNFIDDTVLAWENQALLAEGVFFVYQGQLVTHWKTPVIESTDKQTRGRSSGRNASTRKEASGRRGRGNGRGSRGGTTIRKPRMTKADRARMG